MPRRIADPLFDRLIAALPPDRAYGADDLKPGVLPPSIAHFAQHLLRFHSRQEAERLREARSGRIDYAAPGMREATDAYVDALERHAQIPADEWEQSLRQATQFVTAYLVRPADTLGRFVFGRAEGALPLDKIRRRMRFFQAYGYLQQAVPAYAEKKGIDALTREQLESVAAQVSDRITQDYDTRAWMEALEPLFTLAEAAGLEDGLPADLLRTFFEARGTPMIGQRVRQSDAQPLGADRLRELIADVLEDRDALERHDTSAGDTPAGDASDGDDAEGTAAEGRTSDRGDRSTAARSGRAAGQEAARSGVDAASEAGPQGGSSDRDAQTASPSGDAESASDDDEPTPLWKRFQRKNDTGAKEQNESGPAPSQSVADSAADSAASADRASTASSEQAASEGSSSRAVSANDEEEGKPLWARFQRENGPSRSQSFQSDRSSGTSSSAGAGRQDESSPSPRASSPEASPAPDDTSAAGEGEPSSTVQAIFGGDAARQSDAGSAAGTTSDTGPGSAPNPGSGANANVDEDDSPAEEEGGASAMEYTSPGLSRQDDDADTASGDESRSALEALEADVLGERHPAHRGMYVRELFNGAEDEYREVLARLREAGSWSEASQTIARDVFRANKVNIYSEAAVSFTDAVEAQYRT